MPPLPPPATPPAPAGDAARPCFSFGANMAPTVLARRGVQPLASEAAVVADAGWALSFGHRGGYATLTRRGAGATSPGAAEGPSWQQPHGVLHTLSPADLARLATREVGYTLAQLPVLTYSGELRTADVFLSSPLLRLYRPVPPTQRYLALLLEGARHHCLDPSYMTWLESLEAAPAGQLDSRYDDCPSDTLAKLLAVSAAGAAAVAAAHN